MLDTAAGELKSRFSRSGDLQKYNSLEDVLLLGDVSNEARMLLTQYKEIIFDDFRTQIVMFRKYIYTTLSEAIKLCSPCLWKPENTFQMSQN